MHGDRFRSRPTPSVFAHWGEYRFLNRVLRRYGAVWQGVPNVSTKVNVLGFLAESAGWGVRDPLRTMVITLMDVKVDRMVHRTVGALSRLFNTVLGADLRLQSLPVPFEMHVDGMEVPVLEEDRCWDGRPRRRGPPGPRRPAPRPRLPRALPGAVDRMVPGAHHRDLDEARILDCPEAEVVGATFGEVARRRGQDPVDTILDVLADHGTTLRWHTVIANDRPDRLEWIMDHPDVLIGFSDTGAHLRNMAYYTFPLRMLERVRDAELAGLPFMTVGRAVHRLTAEIADYLGIDGGTLAPRRPADLVVVDPTGLDDRVEQMDEAPMAGLDGYVRYVRRNPGTVRSVLVNGHLAWHDDAPGDGLGEQPMGHLRRPIDRPLTVA